MLKPFSGQTSVALLMGCGDNASIFTREGVMPAGEPYEWEKPPGWEDRPPLPDLPDGVEPPEIFIPEGRARKFRVPKKYRIEQIPPRKQVESQLPYLREEARLGRSGAQWDFEDEPRYGPTREEYRNTLQNARQQRNEEIIRLRTQQRNPWAAGPLLTPDYFWFNRPFDTRPKT